MTGVSLNVDPGSSVTTAVCRLPGGATLPLTVNGLPFLPSAVAVTDDGTIHIGHRLPADGRIVRSPLLGLTADLVEDAGEAAGPVEVFAAVLRRLNAEATAATGMAVTQLRVVVPPAWGPRRRNLVRKAAAAAGLPVPELPSGPAALATGAGHSLGITVPVDGFLLVCDIGASGTTASVVRRRTDVDAEVVSTITAVGAGTDALDGLLTLRLTAAVSGSGSAPGGLAPAAVRAARRSASDADEGVPVAGTGLAVTRDLVEEESVTVVARAGAVAAAAVEAADLDPGDLAAVVVVGGGAHLPGAAAAVSAAVGVTAVVPVRPEQAVVLAAAQASPAGARRRWAATRPADGLLRLMAPTVTIGIISLALLNHALVSAFTHTTGSGRIDYVLFNSGEFAAACALALVTALSVARLVALIDLDRSQASPARAPRPGRVFLSAAGAGLLVVVIYALLTGVYLHQPADVYLSYGFEAALPLAVAGILVAGLAPRLAYLGGTAFDRLRYPATGMILAAIGIAAIQYAQNTPIPPTLIDMISRAGGALAGAGCAWTLIRSRGGRIVAVPLLAAIGALAASVDTNHSYGAALIGCLWFWFAQSLTGLIADAFPDLRTWARQWRPRIVRPVPSGTAVVDLGGDSAQVD